MTFSTEKETSMKLLAKICLQITAIGFILLIQGCYPNCSRQCRENGGCFEGTCECNEGYMGDECGLKVATEMAGTYDVLAINSSMDSVSYQSVFSAIPNDVTRFSLSNFHGITSVTGSISGTGAEYAGPYLALDSQNLGIYGTVDASAYLSQSLDAIEMTYTITDSAGSVEWTATFAR
jgi:hypothetical protein